ncbi:MAG: citrate lyase beta subunit [Myxococcaceae bacterium]|nr:citrate lyase beta subunit [Myxococcaceae bacterium]
MPGANVRALEKARSLPADGLILDLEDAVAPDAKAAARENVVKALAEGGYGKRELFLRINGLETPWGQADAQAAAKSKADVVLVPKVESAAQVRQVAAILEQNGAPAEQTIWVMIETPLGILHAEEIAQAHPRLAGFVMGTSDLVKDLRCAHTAMRLPLAASLGLSVLAARAYGLSILDGVYLNLEDEDGFAAHVQQGKEFGFDGKTLIHPKQVAKANEVFAPSEAEVAQARKIISAYEEAVAQGKGIVVVDGKLIENLHVVSARRQVELADAILALS